MTQLNSLEKQLALAQAEYEKAKTEMGHAEAIFRQGYVNQFGVESKRFALEQAELGLKVRQTAISVLNNYTKEMRLETLRGNLRAGKAKLQAAGELKVIIPVHQKGDVCDAVCDCRIECCGRKC